MCISTEGEDENKDGEDLCMPWRSGNCDPPSRPLLWGFSVFERLCICAMPGGLCTPSLIVKCALLLLGSIIILLEEEMFRDYVLIEEVMILVVPFGNKYLQTLIHHDSVC